MAEVVSDEFVEAARNLADSAAVLLSVLDPRGPGRSELLDLEATLDEFRREAESDG